jgi:hypothetical protein
VASEDRRLSASCSGRKIYESPAEALQALVAINKMQATRVGWRLRGMYRCGPHVHLTRDRGDRKLMAQAVTGLLDQLLASREAA